MSDHTKEPWGVVETDHPETGPCIGIDAESGSVAIMDGPEEVNQANARRVAACVNACSGIETKTLERADGFPQAAAREMKALVRQRDELLAALRTMIAWATNETIPTREAVAKARVAIAKAEAR